MRSVTMTTYSYCALLAAALAFGSIPARAAGTLGDVLRESGWDRIIGTWLDADTNGATTKVAYAWRFKDRLVEITTWEGEKETVSLMGLSAKSRDVFHVSADNQGGSSIGKWEMSAEEASLG